MTDLLDILTVRSRRRYQEPEESDKTFCFRIAIMFHLLVSGISRFREKPCGGASDRSSDPKAISVSAENKMDSKLVKEKGSLRDSLMFAETKDVAGYKRSTSGGFDLATG